MSNCGHKIFVDGNLKVVLCRKFVVQVRRCKKFYYYFFFRNKITTSEWRPVRQRYAIVTELKPEKTYLLTYALKEDSNQPTHTYKEILHTWPSKMCLAQSLIRLRECAVWSESLPDMAWCTCLKVRFLTLSLYVLLRRTFKPPSFTYLKTPNNLYGQLVRPYFLSRWSWLIARYSYIIFTLCC